MMLPSDLIAFDQKREILLFEKSLNLPLARSILKVARSQASLTYAIVTATISICLWRYTGKSAITLWSPRRHDANNKQQVSRFYPIDISFSETTTFRKALSDLHSKLTDIYQKQVTVEEMEEMDDGICVDLVKFHVPLTENKSNIRFSFEVRDEDIVCRIHYNSFMFSDERIAVYFDEIERIAVCGIATPDSPIRSLKILSEREREQILFGFNHTSIERERETISRRFEARSKICPDNIALATSNLSSSHPIFLIKADGRMNYHGDRGRFITYKELNDWANRIAGYLIKKNVGPGNIVAICTSSSICAIACMLGIFKARAVYMPIDALLPEGRIESMLNESKTSLILCDKNIRERFKEKAHRVLIFDDIVEQMANCDSANPLEPNAPDDIAYIMFTSGSTGVQKGVPITHRGVCNLIHGVVEECGIGEESVVLQFSSLGFDASIFEIFLALFQGAKLYLYERGGHFSPVQLHATLIEEGITMATLTPSVLRSLRSDGCDALKTLVSAGEACSLDLLGKWSAPGRRFINAYGPTEISVCATMRPYNGAAGKEARISIGKPIANTRVYIMNEATDVAPIFAKGEICLSGTGLTAGYVNGGELNQSRFTYHPSIQGERIYRTGDWGRWLPDGNIEYLGRMDDQIKLRGCRIQLSEIESHLTALDDVSDAAVVPIEEDGIVESLNAYVVLDRTIRGRGGQDRILNKWKYLFDRVYQENSLIDDSSFDTSGWINSYTGKSFSREEMEEWINETVSFILRIGPRRVLEIGCGSGLLLHRVAPFCLQYVGVDSSQSALDKIKRAIVSNNPSMLSKIDLELSDARNFNVSQTYDTVILNSTVQYFPNAEYLQEVISRAIQVTSENGCIFIGDIRHKSLLPAFHVDLEMHRCPAERRADIIRDRVMAAIEEEDELCIDPSFFSQIKSRFPRITSVIVQPKSGKIANELNRFRYQVYIYLDGQKQFDDEATRVPWPEQGLPSKVIETLMKTSVSDVVYFENLPDSRISKLVHAAEQIAIHSQLPLASENSELLSNDNMEHCSLAAIYQLAQKYNWKTRLFLPVPYVSGAVNVLCVRDERDIEKCLKAAANASNHSESVSECLREYTNLPTVWKSSQDAVAEIKKSLGAKVPLYAMPSKIIPVSVIPLTLNGKIDRVRLIKSSQMAGVGRMEEPADDLENLILTIWKKNLRVDSMGVCDNFFEMGGHSILAAKIVNQIEEILMMEIPISAVFETPTVRSLANVTRELEVEKGKSLMIAKIFNEVDGLDSDEVARILRVQGGDSVP